MVVAIKQSCNGCSAGSSFRDATAGFRTPSVQRHLFMNHQLEQEPKDFKDVKI